MAKIFVINAGSSSIKFKLFDMPKEVVIISGIVEKIGLNGSSVKIVFNNKKRNFKSSIKNHHDAIEVLLMIIIKMGAIQDLCEIKGIGHRVAHGGSYYNNSIIVDDSVVKEVEQLSELAPLHNPINLMGYKIIKERLPNINQVFTFDTAFHHTLNQENYLYALPYNFFTEFRVRKYGAHGINHKYVSEQIKIMFKKDKLKMIICHLGNGSSISAVKNSQCIDTSMGFTPLSGVMMGTRTGDIDPSIMPYLCNKMNKSPREILDIYNNESGFLGISGISSDFRVIEKMYNQNDEYAIRTINLYSRMIAKYIGSYFVELGGCDVIAFTAGIGENSSLLRKKIIIEIQEALEVLIDDNLNNKNSNKNRIISSSKSNINLVVIPANEEIMIARDTAKLLNIKED